jgi:hypothetical protein
LARDILHLSLSQQYNRSNRFFDSAGNAQSVSNLTYTDWTTIFSLTYGITRHFSFGINIPYSLRQVSGIVEYQGLGLGDASFDLRYELWHLTDPLTSAAIHLKPKFPSGSTLSANDEGDLLPLGNGQVEIGPGFDIKQQLGKYVSVQASGTYIFKFDEVVDYLSFSVSDSTGTTTLGNGTIDFGDEIEGVLNLTFAPHRKIALSIDTHAHTFFKTKVNGDEIAYASSSIDAAVGSTDSQGYIVTVEPRLSYFPTQHLEIFAQAMVPLSGKRYPLIILADVVGLTGSNNVTLGISVVLD